MKKKDGDRSRVSSQFSTLNLLFGNLLFGISQFSTLNSQFPKHVALHHHNERYGDEKADHEQNQPQQRESYLHQSKEEERHGLSLGQFPTLFERVDGAATLFADDVLLEELQADGKVDARNDEQHDTNADNDAVKDVSHEVMQELARFLPVGRELRLFAVHRLEHVTDETEREQRPDNELNKQVQDVRRRRDQVQNTRYDTIGKEHPRQYPNLRLGKFP